MRPRPPERGRAARLHAFETTPRPAKARLGAARRSQALRGGPRIGDTRAIRIAYFTAGTVGAGHLARAVALRNGLERAGARAEFRIFSPALSFEPPRRLDVTEIQASKEELEDPRRAPQSALAETLRNFRPHLLLVDMFWAPLRFILPLRACEAWLLVRAAPPVWLRGPSRAPFEPSQLARMLAIEPLPPGLDVAERIDPVVIANPGELLPRRGTGASGRGSGGAAHLGGPRRPRGRNGCAPGARGPSAAGRSEGGARSVPAWRALPRRVALLRGGSSGGRRGQLPAGGQRGASGRGQRRGGGRAILA